MPNDSTVNLMVTSFFNFINDLNQGGLSNLRTFVELNSFIQLLKLIVGSSPGSREIGYQI